MGRRELDQGLTTSDKGVPILMFGRISHTRLILSAGGAPVL